MERNTSEHKADIEAFNNRKFSPVPGGSINKLLDFDCNCEEEQIENSEETNSEQNQPVPASLPRAEIERVWIERTGIMR